MTATKLPAGTQIGAFALDAHVAIGGMSAVYRAHRLSDGQPVAVKLLHDEWCSHHELRARFINEASALAEIRHPDIVAALDHGVAPGGAPYMVLEWLPSTLARALALAGDRLPYPTAARVGVAIASALAGLHERGIIHRDLKPANVLLSTDDLTTADIKLGDLGLSKVPGHNSTRSDPQPTKRITAAVAVSTGGSTVLGTWDYMAPEQWMQSKRVTAEVDVYALGVLLFQMLAGRLPFIAADARTFMALHLLEPPPWHLLGGAPHPPARPPERLATLAAMLSKHAGERPSLATVIHWLSAPGAAPGP